MAAAGVTDIVLAVNYRPEVMAAALKKVRNRPVCDRGARTLFTMADGQ